VSQMAQKPPVSCHPGHKANRAVTFRETKPFIPNAVRTQRGASANSAHVRQEISPGPLRLHTPTPDLSVRAIFAS